MHARSASAPRHRRPIAGALVTLAFGLAPAPGALAQDLSPRVDRDTPAGTEYRLPIESARRQATSGGGGAATPAGAPGGSGASQAAPPLFGEGVGPPARTSRTSRTRDGAAERATPDAPPPRRRAGTPRSVQAQARPPEGAGGALVAVGGAGSGVLLVGGLAGLAWRRRTMGR